MSTRHDDGALNWHTSSYSDKQNCVEVAETTADIRVRDTKDRDGHELRMPRRSWASFLVGCQAGEFDL